MNHKWIAGVDGNTLQIDNQSAQIFSRLKSFAAPSKLQMEMLMMLVGLMDEEFIEDNMKAF